jgi:acyl-CoA thioester hydrolase
VTADPGQGFVRGTVHVFPVRVYYEDTDVGGVVYYANYLKFAERARSEMLRCLGYPLPLLAEQDGCTIAVRRCEADYIRPARFDDPLEVRTGNVDMEAASLWLDQSVWRGEEELVRMRVRLACLGPTGRPARVPDALRRVLKPFEGPANRSAPFSPNSADSMRPAGAPAGGSAAQGAGT